jgi:hypothetical protein
METAIGLARNYWWTYLSIAALKYTTLRRKYE